MAARASEDQKKLLGKRVNLSYVYPVMNLTNIPQELIRNRDQIINALNKTEHDPVYDAIYKQGWIPLSHTRDESCGEVPLTIDLDKTPEQKYTINKEFRLSLHWGQLKLFISEIELLLLAKKKFGNKKIVFVYPGSASGYHITMLSKMFKDIYFILVDPNKYDNRLKFNRNVFVHEFAFFTDTYAKFIGDKVASKFVVIFHSDIRSDPPRETNIVFDMIRQREWAIACKSELSMFKFRCCYRSILVNELDTGDYDKTSVASAIDEIEKIILTDKFTYCDGTVYLQAFAPHNSTETRLISTFKELTTDKEYNQVKYEDNIYSQNRKKQCQYTDAKFKDINFKPYCCNCFNCAVFQKVVKEYCDFYKIEMTADFLVEIQENTMLGDFTIKDKTLHQYVRNSGIFTEEIDNQLLKTKKNNSNAKYKSNATISNFDKFILSYEQLDKLITPTLNRWFNEKN